MTFPNVFGASPGDKLNFLSFDHTTGRLVIEGTATVSEDGQFLTTDPGTGVTHPGWHGLVPPGTENSPPCDPTATHDKMVDPVPVTSGLQDRFYKDDSGQFTLLIRNAATLLESSDDPCDSNNIKATPLVVNLKVEGPADEFLSGLRSQDFELEPQQERKIEVEVKDLIPGIKTVEVDRLYGVKVSIQGYKHGEPESRLIDKEIFIYRYLDATDSKHDDGALEFPDTVNDGLIKVQRTRPIEPRMPPSARPTLSVASNTNFDALLPAFGLSTIFDPRQTNTDLTTTLKIEKPGGGQVGTLVLKGDGVVQDWLVDTAVFSDVLVRLSTGALVGASAAERQLIDSGDERDSIVNNVITRTEALMGAFSGGLNRSNASTVNSIDINKLAAESPCPAEGGCTLGNAFIVDNSSNGGVTGLVANRARFSRAEQNFRLSEALNEQLDGEVDTYIDRYLELRDFAARGITALERALAKTFAHEIGHNVGINHTSGRSVIAIRGATGDVMAQGIDSAGSRTFDITANAFRVAVGIGWTSGQAQQAIDYFDLPPKNWSSYKLVKWSW